MKHTAPPGPAPVTAGFDGTQLTQLFVRLVQTTVCAAAAYIVVGYALVGDFVMVLGPLLMVAAGIACLFFFRNGRHHLAMSVFIWALWVVVALQSSLRGGAANPILNINVVLVLLAGWLVGMRQAWWVCMLSLAWLGVLTYLEAYTDWHPAPPANVWRLLISQMGVLLGAFLAFRLVLKAYAQHVEKVQSLNHSLAEKVQALSRQEEVVRQSERRVVQVLQASPLPIIVAEFVSGACLEVNPAWERAFQRKRADVMGKTPVQLGFWRDEAQREHFKQQFGADLRVSGFDVTFTLPDGTERTFLLSSERFLYGELDCVMTISMDVTERKLLEQQLKELNATLEQRVLDRTQALDDANRNLVATMGTLQRAQEELIGAEKLAALGSLVAGVAHELNTPIGNALVTASALHELAERTQEAALAGSMKKSTFHDFMEQMNDGASLMHKSLSRAVELIGSFKQVAVDQESERRRTFDLHQMVHEVIDTLRPSIKKSDVRIALSIPEGVEMESFPGPLGQVLMNLVNNALIHGLEGVADGVVEVSATASADARSVTLRVADNGRGIAPEHLAHVFDPFFTTKLGQGGSGLGLAVSHRIATRVLGGRLRAQSQPGQGSRFELTIPRVAPAVVN